MTFFFTYLEPVNILRSAQKLTYNLQLFWCFFSWWKTKTATVAVAAAVTVNLKWIKAFIILFFRLHLLFLVRVLYGINNGRLCELEQVLVKQFFGQWFFGVIGIKRWHRRWWLQFLHSILERRVEDSCKGVRRAGRCWPVNIQHVVFSVDSPDL